MLLADAACRVHFHSAGSRLSRHPWHRPTWRRCVLLPGWRCAAARGALFTSLAEHVLLCSRFLARVLPTRRSCGCVVQAWRAMSTYFGTTSMTATWLKLWWEWARAVDCIPFTLLARRHGQASRRLAFPPLGIELSWSGAGGASLTRSQLRAPCAGDGCRDPQPPQRHR